MQDVNDIRSFWPGFSAHVASFGPGAATDQIEQAAAQLARLWPALTAGCALVPGGLELTISASGVLQHFAAARMIVAAAPQIPGLRIRALRAPRPIPDTVGFAGTEIPLANARFHALPVLSRYGVLLLLSGVKISDYVVFRNLGQRIVMDAVGEELFGMHVTDVQVMDHAVWEFGAEGAVSQPLAELVDILPPAPLHSRQPGPNVLEMVQDNRRAA